MIKSSNNAADAKTRLMAAYEINENQAKAIVDMKLGKLAGLEKIELQQEAEELRNEVRTLMLILASEEEQKAELRFRLETIVKKYGDARRTELAQIELPKAEKEIELVTPEPCVVIMSQTGEIKRVATSNYKPQNRNGKGVKTADDTLLDMISTNTIDTLMLFTNKVKMYRLLVDDIPVGTNASKGVMVGSIVKLESDERVVAITSLYRKSNAKYVVFITKSGLFKKTLLEEYMAAKRSSGIAAIKLKEGDSIANVTFANEEEFIIITKQGMSIRFETKDIAPIGRVTSGVKSIKLNDEDEVVVGLPIKHDSDALATFSSNGMARKTALSDFPVQGRGGKGLKVGSGEIVAAALIADVDKILIVGKPNSICIAATDIPLLTRTSLGNQMIKNSVVKDAIKLKL
jgi:DNA gyrase subunit A